jgi:hypothetical protein
MFLLFIILKNSSNSQFLIVRFESETEAFMAYRDMKDMYNGKLIKRLKATIY